LVESELNSNDNESGPPRDDEGVEYIDFDDFMS